MEAKRIQVRGCLPVLAAAVVVAALLAAAVTASVAFAVVAVAAGLVAALVRRARGLGRAGDEATPAARRRAADVTIDAEVVEPPAGAEGRPRNRLE